MSVVVTSLLCVVGVFLFLALLLALSAPLEALGWWAGWSRRELQPDEPLQLPVAESQAEAFVVYLTGIAGFSGDFLGRRELAFLEGLAQRLPNVQIIHDVFPFSVTNNPLGGQRLLSRLWRWLQQRRLKHPNTILKNLIATRNILQAAVSADPRYGPIYNVGVAREIVRSLLRHGYPPTSQRPIYLIGVSGGGQVALGAARFLHQALEAPIRIISLAGVMSNDPGIAFVDHLYHLQGSKDQIPTFGLIFYPGRWPFMAFSAWNQARKQGKISTIATGPMTHMGPQEYLSRSAILPNGQSHADRTADIIIGIIAAKHPPAAEAGAVQSLPSQEAAT